VVICLERHADLHMAQLMPLPFTVCCFSEIQTGFTFLVPVHPGSPGKRAVKCVCVCVRACVRVLLVVLLGTHPEPKCLCIRYQEQLGHRHKAPVIR